MAINHWEYPTFSDKPMWEISDNIEFQVDISMMISSSCSFTPTLWSFSGGPGMLPSDNQKKGHVEIPKKK